MPINNETKRLIEAEDDWLVHTEDGKQMRPSNFYRAYRCAVEGSPFEGVGLHDLRSSFATQLIQHGVDIRTASEMLGHSPAMLAEVYARSSKDVKVAALERLK